MDAVSQNLWDLNETSLLGFNKLNAFIKVNRNFSIYYESHWRLW